MGGQQSFLVANAYHDNVFVKVRSERIAEYSRSRRFSAELEASLPTLLGESGVSASGSGSRNMRTEYFLQIEEGYLMIPALGISTFKPASNITKTVYVSMYRQREDGTRHFMAQDVPHGENLAVIVTCNGGIVDARCRREPWIDLGGRDHYCEECHADREQCAACRDAGGCAAVRDNEKTTQLLGVVTGDFEKLNEDLDQLKGVLADCQELSGQMEEIEQGCQKMMDSFAILKNRLNV